MRSEIVPRQRQWMHARFSGAADAARLLGSPYQGCSQKALAPLATFCRRYRGTLVTASSERLQEGDERFLVGVGESRLPLAAREIVGSEVVTLVDHEVRALGDLEQVRHERRELLACLVVAGTGR